MMGDNIWGLHVHCPHALLSLLIATDEHFDLSQEHQVGIGEVPTWPNLQQHFTAFCRLVCTKVSGNNDIFTHAWNAFSSLAGGAARWALACSPSDRTRGECLKLCQGRFSLDRKAD